MRTIYRSYFLSFLILFTFSIGTLLADGVHQQEQGAATTAQGGAFVARANNPSALYFNPAGLTQLKGTQFSIGGSLIFPATEYSGAAGQFEMESQVLHPVNLYFSHKVSDKLSVGMGYYRPFAYSSKWESDFVGRFLCETFTLKTYYYSAAVAYQVSPKMSVAAGLSYIHANLGYQNAINLSPYSQYYPQVLNPEGDSHFDASADNIGVNIGVLYKIDEFWTIGASYRTPVDLDFSGNFDFIMPESSLGSQATDEINNLFPDQSGSMKFKMPQVIVVGVSTTMIEHTTIEADIQWSGWSAIEDLPINYTSNTDAVTDTIIDRRWKNAFAVRLGAEYEYKTNLLFRAGYYYDNSAIPGETLDPMVPDALKQSVSGGIGIKWDIVDVDVAYGLVFYEKRIEDNEFLSGSYESFSQVLSLSLTFKF
jgi:long-chain fatty acid transport protein